MILSDYLSAKFFGFIKVTRAIEKQLHIITLSHLKVKERAKLSAY